MYKLFLSYRTVFSLHVLRDRRISVRRTRPTVFAKNKDGGKAREPYGYAGRERHGLLQTFSF
jgi:hypothetical protein